VLAHRSESRNAAPAGNGRSERVVTYEPVETSEPPVSFGDRLAEQVARRESQLVLGLDPDPSRLWARALELVGGVDDPSTPPAARAARAVVRHCRLLIDAAGDQCVAVKPQVACFERLGAPGWQALADVVVYARAAGLLVIADAKRGDVDVSADAYAQAFFGETQTPYGPVEGLGVDALTVSPWLGADSLAPFVKAARNDPAHPRGLFVLARNSNPGAADLQDLELATGTVSEVAAAMIASLGADGIGSSGLSDVGAVVGATAPQRLERLRAAMPNAIFLLPGVGAQGGQVEALAAAFAPGPAAGLVSVSRGIAYAYARDGGDPADSARRESARLRDSLNRLVSRS
jgi:orotidine-5'-phosphate decarboxylase